MLLWGSLSSLVLALIAALVLIPAFSPATGAYVADLLRSVLGPRPVAAIETVSFRLQDSINRLEASHNNGKLQISLNSNNSGSTTRPVGAAHFASQIVPKVTATDVVTAPPQIGWQAYGPSVNGETAMARSLLTLDPQRPYAGIALVRIDLSKLQLHMVPGFLEPSHSADVVNAIPNLGMIPEADKNILVAAFNGGFKAVNGNYGMMVNGFTLLPPIPGIATVAVYRDGHVNIGAWGQEITLSKDMVAYRQNCPLILHNGQLNPDVAVDDRSIWGQTIGNQEIAWRTGIGITKDGRYLIYAVGNATTVETLAKALLDAGAFNAMQLDINRHYAHFVTYQPEQGGALIATQLLDQMENDPNIYLTAHSRDYFYLTFR